MFNILPKTSLLARQALVAKLVDFCYINLVEKMLILIRIKP